MQSVPIFPPADRVVVRHATLHHIAPQVDHVDVRLFDRGQLAQRL
jgi:hypothetical protein